MVPVARITNAFRMSVWPRLGVSFWPWYRVVLTHPVPSQSLCPYLYVFTTPVGVARPARGRQLAIARRALENPGLPRRFGWTAPRRETDNRGRKTRTTNRRFECRLPTSQRPSRASRGSDATNGASFPVRRPPRRWCRASGPAAITRIEITATAQAPIRATTSSSWRGGLSGLDALR